MLLFAKLAGCGNYIATRLSPVIGTPVRAAFFEGFDNWTGEVSKVVVRYIEANHRAVLRLHK